MLTLLGFIAISLGLMVGSRRINNIESRYAKRVATKTNLEMQKKIERAFRDRYEAELSIVAPSIDDIYEFIIEIINNAGLGEPTLAFPTKEQVNRDIEAEKVTLAASLSKIAYEANLGKEFYDSNNSLGFASLGDYLDYSKNNETLFARLHSAKSLSRLYEYLICEETERAMWKRGYKYTYLEKDSDWQEAEKAAKQYEEGKSKYPWRY